MGKAAGAGDAVGAGDAARGGRGRCGGRGFRSGRCGARRAREMRRAAGAGDAARETLRAQIVVPGQAMLRTMGRKMPAARKLTSHGE